MYLAFLFRASICSTFCSCTGKVVSLKGEPIEHPVLLVAEVIKEAEGCTNAEESSQADSNGQFRIRGLKVRMNVC